MNPSARTTAPSSPRPADRPVDDQLVRQGVDLLAPSWSTWSLQTLAQTPDGMRLTGLNAAMPFIPNTSLHKCLTRLTRIGLVDRPAAPDRNGLRLYRITDAGRAALPVQRRMADWAYAHLCRGEKVPLAEAAEIGFTQIRGIHTLDTLAAVRQAGHATTYDLVAARPHPGRTYPAYYLADAHALGLLDRVTRGRYVLSAAAHDLAPVLEAVADFARHRNAPEATAAAAPARTATVMRTARATADPGHRIAAGPGTPSRAAAAASVPARSTPPRSVPAAATAKPAIPVPAVAFSHADGQPGRSRW